MDSDNIQWKAFVTESLSKAKAVLSEDHVGGPVRDAIKDLMKIAENLEQMLYSQAGQNADQRVLKKRYDQVKHELREQEKKIEPIKAAVGELVELTKAVATEANLLLKRHRDAPESPDFIAATRLKAMSGKIVEIIIRISQV